MNKLLLKFKFFFIITISLTTVLGQDCEHENYFPGDIMITEVFSKSNGNIPDYIELHNTTNSRIDIINWVIKIGTYEISLYVPNITNSAASWHDVYDIPPNGYLLITGFDGYFSGEDGTVYLAQGDLRTLSEDECDDCGEYNEGFDNFIYNSPNIDTLSNGVWASFSLSHMSSSIQLIDCGGEEVIDQIYYEHDPNGDSQWEEDEEWAVGNYSNANFFGKSIELGDEFIDNGNPDTTIIENWRPSKHSTPYMFTASEPYNNDYFFMEFGSPGKTNLLTADINVYNMWCGPIQKGIDLCSELGSECTLGRGNLAGVDPDFINYVGVTADDGDGTIYCEELGINNGVSAGQYQPLPSDHEWVNPTDGSDAYIGLCIYTCRWATDYMGLGEIDDIEDNGFNIFHDQIPGGSKTLKFEAIDDGSSTIIDDGQIWIKNGSVIQLGQMMETSFSQGIHELVLLLKNDQDLWAVDSFNFEIKEPNSAPVAIIDATDEVIQMPHNGDPTPSITQLAIFGNQSCDCDDIIYKSWIDDYIVLQRDVICNDTEVCENPLFNDIPDEESEIDIYYWTRNGQNVSTNPDLYSYVDTLGYFPFSLIITDNYGSSGDASIIIDVQPEPNIPPDAVIFGDPYVEFPIHNGIPFDTEFLFLTDDYPYLIGNPAQEAPAVYNFSEDQMLSGALQQNNDPIYSEWYFVDGNVCINSFNNEYCITNNDTGPFGNTDADGHSWVQLPIGTYSFVLNVFDSYSCHYAQAYNLDDTYCGHYINGPEYLTDDLLNNGEWDDEEILTDCNDDLTICDGDEEEDFTDCNDDLTICDGDDEWNPSMGNGVCDEGEDFTDCNDDLTICDGDDEWDPSMGNGVWDEGWDPESMGNGVWDEGEEFIDFNGNEIWDDAEVFIDFNGNGVWDSFTSYSDDTDTITVIFSEPNDPPTVFAAPSEGLTFFENDTSTIYAEVFDPEFLQISSNQDGDCFFDGSNYLTENPSDHVCHVAADDENFDNPTEKCCIQTEWDLLWICDGECNPFELPSNPYNVDFAAFPCYNRTNFFDPNCQIITNVDDCESLELDWDGDGLSDCTWYSGLGFQPGQIPYGATGDEPADDDLWLINPDSVILKINAQENINFEPDTLYIELRATDPFYNAGYASDDFISRDTAIVYIINENGVPVYGCENNLQSFPPEGFLINEDETGINWLEDENCDDANYESDDDNYIDLNNYFSDPDEETLQYGYTYNTSGLLEEEYHECIDDDGNVLNPENCGVDNIKILEGSNLLLENQDNQSGDVSVNIFASDSETTLTKQFWVRIQETNDVPVADVGTVTVTEFFDSGTNDPISFILQANPGTSEDQEIQFFVYEQTKYGEYTFDNVVVDCADFHTCQHGTYEPKYDFFGKDTLKYYVVDEDGASSDTVRYVFIVEKGDNIQPEIQLNNMYVYEDQTLELNVNSNESLEGERFIDCNEDCTTCCCTDPAWDPITMGNGVFDDNECEELITDIDGDGEWDPGHPQQALGFTYIGLNVLDPDNNCSLDSSPHCYDSNNIFNTSCSNIDSENECISIILDDAEVWDDSNSNGVWDEGEEFDDSNGNGVWDDSAVCVWDVYCNDEESILDNITIVIDEEDYDGDGWSVIEEEITQGLNYIHLDNNEAGDDIVIPIKVNDGQILSEEEFISIYIIPENDPPYIDEDIIEELNEDQIKYFTLEGYDHEGDEMTYSIIDTTIYIDGVTLSPPFHGQLITDNLPNIEYIPDPDYNGEDYFYYEIEDNGYTEYIDNDGSIVIAADPQKSLPIKLTLDINSENDPPHVETTYFKVQEDSTLEDCDIYFIKEAEEFIDLNENNIWDQGEEFTDCSDIGITLCDGDEGWNSEFGNGEWDGNEEFIDLNNNDICDGDELFLDCSECEIILCEGEVGWIDDYGNNSWDDEIIRIYEDSDSIEFYLIWTDIDIDPYLNQDSDPQSPNVIQWSFNTSIVDSTLKFFIDENTINPYDSILNNPRRYRGKFTIDNLLESWNGIDSSTITIEDEFDKIDYQFKISVAAVNDPPTIDTVRVDTTVLVSGIDYIINEQYDIPISIPEDSDSIPLFIHFFDIDSDPTLNINPAPLLDYSWNFQTINNRFTVLNDTVFEPDTADIFWIDSIQSNWNGIDTLKIKVTDSEGESYIDLIPFSIFQVNDLPEPFKFYPRLDSYPLYPDTNSFYPTLFNEYQPWTFRLPESDVPQTEKNPVKFLIKWERTTDKDLDTLLSEDVITSSINNLYYRLELTTDDSLDYTIVLESGIKDSIFDLNENYCNELNISEQLCLDYGLIDSLAFTKIDLTDVFFGYKKNYFDSVFQGIDTSQSLLVDISGNTLYNLNVIAYNSERDEDSDLSEVDEIAGYDAYGLDLPSPAIPANSQSKSFRADLLLPEFQFNIIRNEIFWDYYDLYIIQSEPILESIEGSDYTPILELEYEFGGRDTISRTSSEHGPIYFTNTFKDTGDITFRYSARDLVENYGMSEKTIHYKIIDPEFTTTVTTPENNSSIIFLPGDVPEITSVIASELIQNNSSSFTRSSFDHLRSVEFIPENLQLNNPIELRFFLEDEHTNGMNYWHFILLKKVGQNWIELENKFTLNNNILKTEIDQLGAYSIISNLELIQPLPEKFILHKNYPNPFNGNTYIKYELPIDAHIKVEIVDILGTVVKILHNNNTTAGYHSLNWDGTNSNGTKSASGIYFINLKMNKTQNHIQKIMYLK